MRETDFLARWHAERDVYRAWGQFVQEEIERELKLRNPEIKLSSFLKITSSRLKDDDTLLGKAFHRDKGYADPYTDIEDKVGVRFVVLLTEDIRILQQVIQASELWSASLDKDFEAERDLRPLEFVYQSKHYVLKGIAPIKAGGLLIPIDTPCEVQLRTLLQHAHSELTHSNIYKREAGSPITKRVERTVAKSMALIEAVDDYFVQALRELESATEEERAALQVLTNQYKSFIGYPPHVDKSNALVLHAFKSYLGDTFENRIHTFITSHSFIIDRIRDRSPKMYIFRQPWILLAYMLVNIQSVVTADIWPLTAEELRPIYTDLGKPFPGG